MDGRRKRDVIIDMHAHIGDLRSPNDRGRTPITTEALIARLDEEGIERAAVLPWPICPEAVMFPGLFVPESDVVGQIRAAARHPDRLIPFGNADPRWGGNSPRTDFSWLLERFVEMGCVGMGEVSANIYFDDPRTINLFRQCGRWDLPVTMESCGPGEGHYGFIDEIGSPHLGSLLQQVPGTVVVGHGPGFWADIGGHLKAEEKSGYPQGAIVEEGSVARLLRVHPNLYADISAFSGYNALTRDEAYGVRFLNEFQDRLMFGTDVCFADPEGRTQHLNYIRRLLAEGKIDREAFEKITCHNALRIMKRYKR
jgi:predicted TIM-barrel fold metal-dependent hydrolase